MTTDQTQFTTAIPGVRDMRSHQGLGSSATTESNALQNAVGGYTGAFGPQGADAHKPLKAILTALEGNYALLQLSDSSEVIKWPKTKIPSEAKIGDALLLEAVSLSKLKEEELSRMRQLLEDLIN